MASKPAEVAQNLTDAVSDENLIWVFLKLGRFYSGQGLYASAEPWLVQCAMVALFPPLCTSPCLKLLQNLSQNLCLKNVD